jgi:hypothetical protein
MSSFKIYNNIPESVLYINGKISTLNSSDDLIAFNSSFIGISENVINYVSVTSTVKTDQNGTLYIEFSPDNINWDVSHVYTFTAPSTITKTVNISGQYCRIKFTNTGGTQTYFRVQTIFGAQTPASSSGSVPEDIATTTLQTIGNNKLDTVNTSIGTTNTKLDTVNTSIGTTNTKLDTVNTSIGTTNTKLDTVNTSIGTTNTKLDTVNTSLTTIATNTTGLGGGIVSTLNSTVIPLNNGDTFTGTGEDVSAYSSVCVTCKTDQSGLLYIEFSPDNTNWDSILTFNIAANTNEVHRITISRKYYRCRMYNNSGVNQTFLRLQTLIGDHFGLTSIINSTIQDDADSLLTRAIITGKTNSGSYLNVPVDESGHLEVSLHGPLLPFGSVHTESLIPIFQNDAVYGINNVQIEATQSGSGLASAADSLFTTSTGVTIYSFAAIQGKKRLRYRPGQGIIARFAGRFTTPVADSYQVMGVGHAEDGLYFGYKGLNFGILYNRRGVRECRTLTITTGSSTAQNITITLNNTPYTVGITNSSGNVNRTCYEISIGTYAGWSTDLIGSTVIFLADSVGSKNGTYSLSGATTAVGTFALTKAGANVTETFIAQTDWNSDKLDGTGSSGFVADWTKGNVFQLGIQYLGFGTLTCKVETVEDNSNNATWTTVHTIKLPNTLTTTSFRNPSFPFTMTAYSAGSTTNLSVYAGSFSGFIEGAKILNGNRYSYYNQILAPSTLVAADAYYTLFIIKNMTVFQNVSNQSVINLLSISAALKHNSPCIIYLIRNPTIVGNPIFSSYSTTSCSSWSPTLTTIATPSNNDQILWSGHIGDTGQIDHYFNTSLEDLTLQPGDSLAVCARTTTGSATCVTASLNTREDQ